VATLRAKDQLRLLPQHEEKRLLHEFQSRQIELEMQNEEMGSARVASIRLSIAKKGERSTDADIELLKSDKITVRVLSEKPPTDRLTRLFISVCLSNLTIHHARPIPASGKSPKNDFCKNLDRSMHFHKSCIPIAEFDQRLG
jgi:hypothetical protein